MPIQKGKKRKRARRHGPGSGLIVDEESGARPAPVTASARSRPSRRRWEFPLWANLSFGLALVALGVIFAVAPSGGMPAIQRTIILLGYFALSALYLGKAFRQYRAGRGGS